MDNGFGAGLRGWLLCHDVLPLGQNTNQTSATILRKVQTTPGTSASYLR